MTALADVAAEIIVGLLIRLYRCHCHRFTSRQLFTTRQDF